MDNDFLLLLDIIDDVYPGGNPPQFYSQALGRWDTPNYADLEIFQNGTWVPMPTPPVT